VEGSALFCFWLLVACPSLFASPLNAALVPHSSQSTALAGHLISLYQPFCTLLYMSALFVRSTRELEASAVPGEPQARVSQQPDVRDRLRPRTPIFSPIPPILDKGGILDMKKDHFFLLLRLTSRLSCDIIFSSGDFQKSNPSRRKDLL
jgi:hypothetical protein